MTYKFPNISQLRLDSKTKIEKKIMYLKVSAEADVNGNTIMSIFDTFHFRLGVCFIPAQNTFSMLISNDGVPKLKR